jgi:transposase
LGHNRNNGKFVQVNFELARSRSPGIPLHFLAFDENINKIKTLKTTIQLLKNFDYAPNCLILDIWFSAQKYYMVVKNDITFLQGFEINTNCIKEKMTFYFQV